MANQTKYEIASILTLSTSHISGVTRDAFEGNDDDAPEDDWVPAHMTWDYGWLVWVEPDYSTERYPELVAILALARSLGCEWVRLDADGPVLAELPTHVWPEDVEESAGDPPTPSACERNSGEGGLV